MRKIAAAVLLTAFLLIGAVPAMAGLLAYYNGPGQEDKVSFFVQVGCHNSDYPTPGTVCPSHYFHGGYSQQTYSVCEQFDWLKLKCTHGECAASGLGNGRSCLIKNPFAPYGSGVRSLQVRFGPNGISAVVRKCRKNYQGILNCEDRTADCH